MVLLSLECAIVGQVGSSFDVKIDDGAKVSELKKAIKGEKPDTITGEADKQQLFLAKTDGGAWLDKVGAASVALDEHGHPQGFVQMDSTLWIKNPKHFGANFEPGEGQIHVLVVVPEQEHAQTGLWLVTGSVDNALNTKRIRCRLYRLAGSYLGYYDPARRAEDKDNALWYEGKTLHIHSLFETRENALLFDNALQDESITSTSALNGHTVSTNVASTSISLELTQLRRIYGRDYDPNDTESPQASMLSLSTTTSIVDVATDEFKYQRIESEEWFGSVGKAQSCHVMSKEHCLKYPSYKKYDNDPSNRLALSAELHEWFDARSFTVPTMKISVESTSEGFVIGNRYKARLLSLRLKEGFVVSDDGLEMRTSVYVQNKKVFCECMEWKRKEIEKKWREHEDMAPAVD
nr:CRN effector protein [Phytophthora cinnamomi]